jgi:hypothetical protein
MYNTMVVEPTEEEEEEEEEEGEEEEEEVVPITNSILKLTAIPKTQIEERSTQILHGIKSNQY